MTNPIDFNSARRAAVTRLSTQDKFTCQLESRINHARHFLGRLGPIGMQNWEAFRRTAATFGESQRLQFLSYDPSEQAATREFAQVKKDTFRRLGFDKWDFLCFLGYYKLCNIFDLENKVGDIAEKVLELELSGQTEMSQVLRNIAARFYDKIINPQIRRLDMFEANTDKLRRLLKANWSEKVFMSFEHPNYIWINSTPLPERFWPNSREYGKWVVNSFDTEETFAFAKQLLPAFAVQELGTLKFELATRGNGISCLIVYCQNGDPNVKELVEKRTGKQPFWVSDLFCYEADAIIQLAPILASQCDGRHAMSSELVDGLKDKQFCNARGISEIQAEILWRLLHPDAPEYLDPNTAYSHVIDGYFKSISVEDAEEFGASATQIENLLPIFLPILLAEENKDVVCQLMTRQRQTFERLYSSGKQF